MVLKNKAPFINCISKVNGVKTDNVEDLDVAMPTHNLLEYSKNYRKTAGSLWNYYRDDPNSGVNTSITNSFRGSKSFDYKTNFIEDEVKHNHLTKSDVKINCCTIKTFEQFWEKFKYTIE